GPLTPASHPLSLHDALPISSERSAALPSYFISRTVPMLGDPAAWRLRVDGLVAQPLELSLDDLMRMPRVSYTVKHHCVEGWSARSEEHTSELQSLRHLVCRL